MSTTTTATVLFTDVVSSTELRVALGEARADQLRREHDEIVSAEVGRHSGHVVKGSGDGVLATFASAADALAAAVDIQRALAAYARRPDALAAFDVRVGVSAGDVVFEDGDCFGTPVIEAARLVAACDAGQILCAEIVRMLAHGRGGHDMSSIGFLELKGLPEPLAVWDVAWRTAATEAKAPLPPEVELDLERPLVGRIRELDAAHALVHDGNRRRPAVVWLAGEPGIGKTRLAAEIARRSHEDGAVVLYGRCNEDLPVPYQPFVEALRGFLAVTPDDALATRLGDMAGDLTLLVPEVAQRLPGVPAAVEASSETRQWRLFAAVASWLAAASASGPLVVLIDDVHWATEQTLQLVGHLSRSAEPSRVALVVTGRNTAPDESSALRDLVDDLALKVPTFRRFELAGLEPDDVAALVGLSGDHADFDADAALRLHRETAGNPLYIASLLAGGASDVPTDLAGAVRRRVDRLPGEAGALLRTAAVIGLDVDVRVLAAAANVDEDGAIDAMETAQLAGLVHPAGADGYRFTHALVRAALRQEVSEVRRPRVHARVARAIVDVYGSRLDRWTDALAYHFVEAARAGLEIDEAFRWSLTAAERAEAVGSYPEAARHYGRALDLLPAASSTGHGAAELLVRRGVALRRAGDTPSALRAFHEATELARAAGDPEALGEAVVAFEDATWRPGLLAAETTALVDEAVAALGPGDSDLHLLLQATRVRSQHFVAGHNLDREADAVMANTRGRHPRTRAAVMARTWWGYQRKELTDERSAWIVQFCNEWRDAATAAHDFDLMLEANHAALPNLAEAGEMDAYRHRLAEMEGLLARHPIPFWQYVTVNHHQWQAFFGGDLNEAERLADSALEMGQTLRGEDPSGIHGLRLFLVRREQDRLSELAPVIRTIVQLNPASAMWRPGLTALLAEIGMTDDAHAHLDELCRDDAAAVPDDALWTLCLSFLADACCDLGDASRAEVLHRLLSPWQGRNLVVAVFVTCLGSTDRILGRLAATAGRHDDAVTHLERALTDNRALGSPLWEAHSDYELARVLHERGRGDDAGRVARLLDDAATLAARHGLIALGRRVAALRSSVG